MQLYYDDGQVALYLGDCLTADAWLSADVLVTDPPYGIGWSRGAGTGTAADAAPGQPIAGDADTTARDAALSMWGDTRPGLVFGSVDSDYPPGWLRMLVFGKPHRSGIIGRRLPWFKDWEPIFVIGQWPKTTPSRSSILRTAALSAGGFSGYATRAGHPHTKPVDVLEALVDACPPGTVADPFAGSGSTLVAARNLGRRAIGVEVDERHCETAARRLAQQTLPIGGAE